MLQRPTLSNNFRHLTVKLMANIGFEAKLWTILYRIGSYYKLNF